MKKNGLIIILFLTQLLFAQESKTPVEGPKVGVVLSGGGAKGIAHIGVLKALEDTGIRVDYIGGTSMGAVVGALYASGYSAYQLDSIFINTDIAKELQDQIPRESKSLNQKQHDDRYIFSIPFDNFKIGFPQSLSKGINVYNLLTEYTLAINSQKDFSKFPIPFFCMATDLETGKAVVLEKGFLPQAIQASRAIPTLLSPVEIDGQLLIDGGISNNYPVDIMKTKGVDIIIGVDTQGVLYKADELNSITEVLNQVASFEIYEGMDKKVQDTDVYLKPVLEDYTVASFAKSRELIDKGYQTVIANLDELNKIGKLHGRYKKEDKDINFNPEVQLHSVEIQGNDRYTRSYFMGKLGLKLPDTISFDRIKRGVNSLIATENFDRLQYRLEAIQAGKKMLVEAKESDKTLSLKLGVNYDGLFKTAGLLNLTKKNLISKNDVLSVDMIAGDNLRYALDYYIDKGFNWSFGLSSRFNQFENSFLFSGVQANSYEEFINQIYFQRIFKRSYALGVGGAHKLLRSRNTALEGTEIVDDGFYYSLRGYLKMDTYDNMNFPKKGFLFDSYYRFIVDSSEFEEFEGASQIGAHLSGVKTFYDKLTVAIGSDFGITIAEQSLPALDYRFGGFGGESLENYQSFYGYDYLDLNANSFLKLRAGLRYEFFKKHHLDFYTDIANIDDELFRTLDWFSLPAYSGYAVGYAHDSFLGPIQLKYSWSPDHNEDYWFFRLGYSF